MTDTTEDRNALVGLILAGGPLTPRRRLLDQAGSPDNAWRLGPSGWRAAGLSPEQCRSWQQPDARRLAAAHRWLESADHRHLLHPHHPDWPPLLQHAPQPPLGLFAEGRLCLLQEPAVAVVGSRKASHGGRAMAAALARGLAKSGLLVASGLASGIDAAAHQAGLDAHDSGLAVVGTGPDLCYPASNQGLWCELARRGIVISEYPPGTTPRPHHFPARNRILAGLSLAVVVVEAAERSGALLTARLASEAGREVFAVPGSVHNPLSRGCHRLLRDGAGLLETIDDLLPVLAPLLAAQGIVATAPPSPAPRRTTGPDDPVWRCVWDALETDPIDMDELGLRTGLTVACLSSILPALELDGWISCQHGRFVRSSAPPTPIASSDAGRG